MPSSQRASSTKKKDIERREKRAVALVSLAILALVLLAHAAGLLDRIEGTLYDYRARLFQRHVPPPSPDIVHVHIDEGATQQIARDVGAWPWPRNALAEMVQEMARAGPRVVFLDVLLAERQGARTSPSASAPSATQPAATAPALASRRWADLLDGRTRDEILADAVADAGNVIIPVSVRPYSVRTPDLLQEMSRRLEEPAALRQDEDAFLTGFLATYDDRLPDREKRARAAYVEARQRAIDALLARAGHDRGLVLRRLFHPAAGSAAAAGTPSLVPASFESLLDERLERARQAQGLLGRLKTPLPPGLSLPDAAITTPLILPLVEPIGAAGFANYHNDPDGAARSLPAVAKFGQHLMLHVSVALACEMLGASPASVTVEEDRLTLRPDAGRPPVTVPLRRRQVAPGETALVIDIPWFGRPGDWLTLFNRPGDAPGQTRQQISMNKVWELVQMRRQKRPASAADLRRCAAQLRAVVLDDLARLDPAAAGPPLALVNALGDAGDADLERLAPVTWDALEPPVLEFIQDVPPTPRQREESLLLWRTFRGLHDNHLALNRRLADLEAGLRDDLRGKAVLVGWTSTGLADIVRSSLHAECPGVMAVSTVLNGILTGELWRRLPAWADALATVLMALAAASAVIFLPRPWMAVPAYAALLALFVATNGALLFDRHNLLLGIAAPLLGGTAVFLGAVSTKLLYEQAERQRIIQRFGQYVRQPLVDYLMENPDNVHFDGELRTLSIVYTDLEGFTRLTEDLQQQCVPLLNAYMAEMVPVIERHDGFIDKFLGDGIMFFFGAPIPDDRHAAKAVAAVLDMHARLVEFNNDPARVDLPALRMRAGVSTGTVIVGDAGPPQASDYTVLGDAANLGNRLQTACKLFGAKTLISEATEAHVRGEFLLCPMGRIRPTGSGRREGVRVFEPLCRKEAATEPLRRLVQLSDDVVAAFALAQFRQALDAAGAMERELGESRFTQLYVRLCHAYLRDRPEGPFDGAVDQGDKITIVD